MPLATRNRRVTRWFQKIAKVLINALIIHVGTGRNLSGLATYQELVERESFYTRLQHFCLVR